MKKRFFFIIILSIIVTVITIIFGNYKEEKNFFEEMKHEITATGAGPELISYLKTENGYESFTVYPMIERRESRENNFLKRKIIYEQGKILQQEVFFFKITTWTLYHSFATHMLESGVDIKYIKQLPGHSSLKTTEIYTHLSFKAMGDIKSPLDSIDFWIEKLNIGITTYKNA